MAEKPKSRLRQIYDKIMTSTTVLSTTCEYSSRCIHFQTDSDTCTKSPDKTYCGTYNQTIKGGPK